MSLSSLLLWPAWDLESCFRCLRGGIGTKSRLEAASDTSWPCCWTLAENCSSAVAVDATSEVTSIERTRDHMSGLLGFRYMAADDRRVRSLKAGGFRGFLLVGQTGGMRGPAECKNQRDDSPLRSEQRIA